LHSVEVYQSENLVGGLYGVTYRGAFFGESMFSTVSQSSKCALIKLIEHLREKNFILLDVQYQTEHLKMFGAKEISFDEYEKLLIESYKVDTSF
jgi:leucyl/phenylalanyl-tRNA--protein transferase